ncbi:glutaredoxin family protein [Aliikangiella sp. IMCC44359]|uniref:glutaredoxin family protein n=1 Tax=Aliikangiella sp. IMCC44359 TaxID=3459125 RepID=UPI00403AF507
MRYLLLVIALVGGIKYFFDQPKEFKNGVHPVKLYATSWCGYCQKTREFFAKNGIIYIEYDIERSAQGRKEYEQIAKGSGVPVVLVNDTVIRGYNESKLKSVFNL